MFKLLKLYTELTYKGIISFIFMYPIMVKLIHFDSTSLNMSTLTFSSLHLFGVLIIIVGQNSIFRLNKYLDRINYEFVFNKLPLKKFLWIKTLVIYILLFNIVTFLISVLFIVLFVDDLLTVKVIINMIAYSNIVSILISIIIVFLHTRLKTSDYLVVNYLLLFGSLMTPLLMITIGRISGISWIENLPNTLLHISWIPVWIILVLLIIVIVINRLIIRF